jgi:mono/diheme cytochrome c family protein
MKRGTALPLLLLALAPLVASAQSAGAAPEPKQMLGMRLFNQSCRVCHVKQEPASPQFAPALSKATLAGNAAALRVFIANGTPRMPGFKIQFRPAEIDAIVAYIKTID